MAFVSGSVCFSASSRPASSFCGVRRVAVVARSPARAHGVRMNLDTIQERIASAIKSAEEATATQGKTSKEAAAAWDIVEELEKEASHLKAQGKPDPLEEFCKEAPEADECRTYEN